MMSVFGELIHSEHMGAKKSTSRVDLPKVITSSLTYFETDTCMYTEKNVSEMNEFLRNG